MTFIVSTFQVILYFAVMLSMIFLVAMSLYQLFLVISYRRNRGDDPVPETLYENTDLPVVTIQLPVYNEGPLAEQILRLAAAVDYPADKLEIQYLDDSDDGVTTDLAVKVIEQLRAANPDLNISYLRRTDRTGFKAGALKLGAEHAKGEFLAIFDADFLIPEDFLRRTIHFFNTPSVGAVQARWDYTNSDTSLFARLQANKLDSHQMFEQTARERMGLVTIFHGTAGIWRRKTLDQAGGWDCISEVEDVELTIRAATKDWKLVYLDHYRIFSELPENVNAFLRQQMRWRRGWSRVVRHYSKTIIKSDMPVLHRVDLLVRINLTWGPIAGLIATLGVLPVFLVAKELGLTAPTFLLYTFSLLLGMIIKHYETKTFREDRQPRKALDVHPLLAILPLNYIVMSLGTLWPLAHATFEGFGKSKTWEVTPKSGTTVNSSGHAAMDRKRPPSYVFGTIALGVISAVLSLISLLNLNVLPAIFYAMLALGCGLNGLMLMQFFGYSTGLARPITRALIGQDR